MILAVDWTVVAASGVTGTTAVLVGFFGYLGTRHANTASLRQAENETRLRREERLEDARNRRAEAYYEYLLQDSRLNALVLETDDITEERVLSWLEGWHRAHSRVILHGTEGVKEAVAQHGSIFVELWNEHVAGHSRAEMDRHLRSALEGSVKRREAARQRVVEAMRADTAASAVEEPFKARP